MTRKALVPFALLLAGCDGSALGVGSDERAAEPAAVIAGCPSTSETSRRFQSDDEATVALVGRWTRCRGASVPLLQADGLEFTEDEEWFALDEGRDGPVRAAEPARHGFFSVSRGEVVFFAPDNTTLGTAVFLFDVTGLKMNAVYAEGPVDVAYVRAER